MSAVKSLDQDASRVPFRAGVVAIIGRPNVGKSTLLNHLIKFKLSAVSPKPQTTRHKILGVLSNHDYQVVFLDTPGLPFRTNDVLDRRMVTTVLDSIMEADLVVMMIEPKRPADVERRLVKDLQDENKPAVLVINKIDRISKPELLPLIDECSRLYPFLEIVPISARRPTDVKKLVDAAVKHLPEGEPLFSSDQVTDRPERFLVGEMIREQVFHAYSQEVPYAVAIEIETFQEASAEHAGKDYIKAVLYVERKSQKAILIGKGGEMLKKIGINARQQIESILGRPVHLELWVKVFPNWRKDKAFLQRIGY